MSAVHALIERRHRPLITPRFDDELASLSLLDDLLTGHFTVHGERHHIGDPVNWLSNPSNDIEWQIVLHKMYHAPGLVRASLQSGEVRYLEYWQRHMTSWIASVEPGFIAADVTGRRIQNWVYALSLYLGGGFPVIDWGFVESVEASLRQQIEWLRANLHPVRNHRTLELLALLLGQVWLFADDEAHETLELLAQNAERDFLSDGVHVELSSHYHCLVLRNLCEAIDLALANRLSVPAGLLAITERARRFAVALHKPDGTIPMLGDADVGDFRDLFAPQDRPVSFAHFPESGYMILRDKAAVAGSPDGQYLLFDCGPLGDGNHGHLDCLSIEFAAFGRSLIVDPGRYTYFEGGQYNERAAFRSTAAHNLVQVNGCEQTAYRQGPKRMKIAGPSPVVDIVRATDGDVAARARSSEYDAVVERRIIRNDAGWWLVHDRMTSPTLDDYVIRFQLSPLAWQHCRLVPIAADLTGCLSPQLLMIIAGATSQDIETGWVAPRYGEKWPAPRLCGRLRGQGGWFATLLVPFADEPPPVAFSADTGGYRVEVGGQSWSGDWL